jgi:EAL domain-containing protein (putative c-di-GMP-specific phosphodiesterase class I)/GAF domain-containing protein
MTTIHAPAAGEAARLDALRRLDLLDTAPSAAFDRITRMAAQIFNVPFAAVSLTDADRQWFKSRFGIGHTAIPRLAAPCAAVAESSALLVIPDLLADPGYRDSHLARSGIRFYAGAPLVTSDGFCLGALCVLSPAARQVTPAERVALQDLAAMVMSQVELRRALGRVDASTGLPNRNQLIEDFDDMAHDAAGPPRLAAMVSLASPEQLSAALRVMGSLYLDEIVGAAVRTLRVVLPAGTKVYHVGTTRFVFVAEPGTGLGPFCEHLAGRLAEASALAATRFVTTASVGVAPFEPGKIRCLDLLRNLDSAAHDAFDADNRVSVFSKEQDQAYQRRFWLINEFGAALERPGQLRLVFQPKVDLASGACHGAEALLRWNHPEFGEVSPGEFIPIIERTRLARATTAWVLDAALRQLAAWHADGLALQLAVNVSASNLLEPDFCARVVAQLAQHGLPPAALALEITESGLMKNPKVAHATLEALAAAGVHLAIDDFGTGYSSLAYLQRLPTQVVKIDQSFMGGIDTDARKRALVATMIKLSQDLGHRVVAEGVETQAVADLLKAQGCDEAQGYLYARPMAPAALAEWIAAAALAVTPSR